MGLSDVCEAGLLDLVFLNTAFANIGDASGLQPAATAGSLYVALHTADPTDSGDQTSNECAYTSYARVAVARSGSGWTRSANTISNAAEVAHPTATGGTETATHFSVGVASSGATAILWSGALTASLAISNGITPTAAIGDLSCDLD